MTTAAEPVEILVEDAPRALPKEHALALFAKWYDEHQGDQDATFSFTVSDGGRRMEAVIGERVTFG